MSLLKTIDVQCDHPNCLEWIHGSVGFNPSAKEARKKAHAAGWRRRLTSGRRGWVDLCPAHSASTWMMSDTECLRVMRAGES